MGILAASNSFSNFVVQSQLYKTPSLREHTHVHTQPQGQERGEKGHGDFGGTLFNIKFEVQRLEVK